MNAAFELWEITPQLRWRNGMLEQAWKSPDNRLEWRAVPVLLYDPPEASPER